MSIKIIISILACGVLFAADPPKEIAKKTEPAPVIDPKVKVRLLVFQSKLIGLQEAIKESSLGKQRAAADEKFQAELTVARENCKGGEPTFSDDDVVCKPQEKQEAKVITPPATKE